MQTPPSLNKFMNNIDLFDVWRCIPLGERGYSYFSSVHNIFSRIDMFLVDCYTLQRVCVDQTGHITWSDHAPITLTFSDGAFGPTLQTVATEHPFANGSRIFGKPGEEPRNLFSG